MRKNLFYIACFLILIVQPSPAEENPAWPHPWKEYVFPSALTVDGKQYKEVRYYSHGSARVSFMHSEGMASVMISSLPDSVRQTLNYDPEKAKTAISNSKAAARVDKETFEEKKALASYIKTGIKLRGRVLQVSSDGCLVTLDKKISEPMENIFVHGLSGVVDGSPVERTVWPVAHYQYNSLGGIGRTVRGFAVSPKLGLSILNAQKAAETAAK